MAVTRVSNPLSIGLSRDKDGQRDYTVVFQVFTDNILDGPLIALEAPGLPQPGSMYYLSGNEIDTWAHCHHEAEVRSAVGEQEATKIWTITLHFRTKPFERNSCTAVGDPLLEPPKISGGSKQKTKEVTVDRFGLFIQTSSFEQIRGPQVEFDDEDYTITVEQNVAELGAEDFVPMLNTVNDALLWGMNPRCIKFSSINWRRNICEDCRVYYTRGLEFDVNFNTFDRWAADEGNLVIAGTWVEDTDGTYTTVGDKYYQLMSGANHGLSNHHIQYKDKHDENTTVLLDGYGLPANAVVVNRAAILYKVETTANQYLPPYSINRHVLLVGTVLTPDIIGKTLTLTYGYSGTYTIVDGIEGTPVAILNTPLAAWEVNTWGLGRIGWTTYLTGNPARRLVQHYPESNFLELGIPASF